MTDAEIAAPDYSHSPTGEQVSVRTEFGLCLPNGQISWGGYRGHPTETAQHRWTLLQALRKTAEEVGFDEADFLSRYSWVSREVTTIIKDEVSHSIDNEMICLPPENI